MGRPPRLIAAITVVVVAGVGCGSGPSGQADTSLGTTSAEPSINVSVPSTIPTDEIAGDTATWTVGGDVPPSSLSASFTAMVTRLDCSDGVTGQVLDPVIEAGADQVVITFSVAPLDPALEYTCPSNDAAPVSVRLDEPLGERTLVDGACLGDSAASQTAACETGSVRWQPAATGAGAEDVGESTVLSVGTHCGVGILGRLVNGYVWRTDEADGPDWVPREWYSGPVPPDPLDIQVTLSQDGTILTASLNGREVTYVQHGRAFAVEDQCA